MSPDDLQGMLLGGGLALGVGLLGLFAGDNWWNPLRLKRSIRDRVSPGFSRMFTRVFSIILIVAGLILLMLAALGMAGAV